MVAAGPQPINEDAKAQAFTHAAQPLLAPQGIAESMVQYFGHFRALLGRLPAEQCRWRRVACIQEPGLYMHKRPVRGPGGGPSPLAVCGSVFHHVVLYLLDDRGQLHSLDYGPANGADVTSNIMEAVPARRCLESGVAPPEPDEPGEASALPLLYLGRPALGLQDLALQKALALAESRPYHALRNNCIAFADALVRLLTGVASAPLVFDVVCGQVPGVDNPTLMLLQMMLQASWHSVCDGSGLYAEMVAGLVQGQGTGLAAAAAAAAAAPSPAVAAQAQVQDTAVAQQAAQAASAAAQLVSALANLVTPPGQQAGMQAAGMQAGAAQQLASLLSAALPMQCSVPPAIQQQQGQAQASASAGAGKEGAEGQRGGEEVGEESSSAAADGAHQAAEEGSHAEALVVQA